MKINFPTLFGRGLICILFYATTAAAQPVSLQKRIDQLLNDKFYQSASAGVCVYDLTDGKSLYRHNEKRLCRPASNMKLLTSAAALQFLTSTYEFRTELFHTGTIDANGKLQGNIYLAGGFDPELSSADLDTLVSRLKKAGINDIEGNVYVDVSPGDDVFWGKAWLWDDDLEAFQPYLSPLPINKGVVKLKIIPASPSRPPIIKTDPESSFIRVVNRATTVWKSPEPAKKTIRIGRDCDDKNNRITVSGTIAASSKPYETSVSLKNPNEYALTLFHEKVSARYPESQPVCGGLSEVPVGAQNIGYIKRSLPEVIYRLNKESDNLNAEMLLYALGYRPGNKPSSAEKGIESIQQFIAQLGFDPKQYGIVDGSGLSNQNYLSPELLTTLLTYMYRSPDFEIFKNSLPVAGKDGTLAGRMKGVTVSAKTGSMTGVCALSGYVTARNGHLLAFSVMIQNFTEKASYVATHYVDQLCEALAE